MDRRQFLIGAGRLGLGAGAAALVARCLPPPAPIVAVPDVGPSPVPRESATPSPGPSPSPPGPRDTSIVAENLRRGDRGWDLQSAGFGSAPAMFVGAASVAAGDTLDLHLAGSHPVRVEWYRLGWYGGLGGRLVRVDPNIPAARGRRPSIDPASGRAEAPFPVVASLTVPDEWPSGVYFVVARPTSGAPAGTPFIVRPASGARTAPILFVSAAATWQAYNAWGGADLYKSSMADTPDEVSGRRAVQVSFDRPYLLRHGAGLMPRWELPFVRWQERSGRDVDYCTDVDLELHPEIASGRRLLVFAGHHEYWSRPMRSTLEAAIASGSNVVFLSANEMYWQVRFEPSPLGPARRMTCWKSATADPIIATQPLLTTCRWRERPVSDPEAVVIGQMYGHIVRRSADWIVLGAGHWLYEGTNLRDGDRITRLVGQEYDTFFPRFAPPGTQILARSPVDAVTRREPTGGTPAAPNVQTATIYTADSGATVFAAGTMQWSWALDGYGDRTFRGVLTPQDARVARMTRNLFDRLGDGPLAA